MNKDLRIYGNNFDLGIVRDVSKLNEKIEKEKDPEELLKLRLQRLYRGMEMNSGLGQRNIRGYYPY